MPQNNSSEVPAIKDKEVSTKQFLRFIRFNPKSFAGLHEGLNLAIVFNDPSKRIVGFVGDQGTGKTSSLQALYTVLGGMPPKNAVNEQDKAVDDELVFERNGVQYVVRATKSSFTVTRHEPDGSKSKMEAPKDFLKKIIGPIGLNPMDLKGMKGPDQIKWLRDLTNLSPEQLKLETDLLAKKKVDYDKRTEVKRRSKQLAMEVGTSGYFVYDEAHNVFNNTTVFKEDSALIEVSELDADKVAENLRTAETSKKYWEKSVEALSLFKQNKVENAQLIILLKKQLEDAERIDAELKEKIQRGEQWIEENKNVVEIHETAFSAMQQLSNLKLKAKQIADVLIKVQEHEEKVNEEIALDAKLDEYSKLHKEFVRTFTPEIPGLEVIVAGLDSKKDEGLYYKDRTMIMLSESELFELYIQLLASQHVQVAIIENITSLGTAAIERINWFVEQMGGYVFYSAMERGQEKLGFQFIDKLK